MSKAIDEKFYGLKVDIGKEKKIREDASDMFMGEIEEKIGFIESQIDKEQKWRADNNGKLVK